MRDRLHRAAAEGLFSRGSPVVIHEIDAADDDNDGGPLGASSVGVAAAMRRAGESVSAWAWCARAAASGKPAKGGAKRWGHASPASDARKP